MLAMAKGKVICVRNSICSCWGDRTPRCFFRLPGRLGYEAELPGRLGYEAELVGRNLPG
jgi:hypothetical protein